MKIRELLSQPDKWTKWSLARDKEGKAVRFDDPSAYCFCLLGALKYCYTDEAEQMKVRDILFEETQGIVAFNESVSWEQMFELVTRLDV